MARLLIIGTLEGELGQAGRLAHARGARLLQADGTMAAHGTFQGRRMSGEASRQGCSYNLSLTKR
jgi:hypothetical protein